MRLLSNMAQALISVIQGCVSIQTHLFTRGLNFKFTAHTSGITPGPAWSGGVAGNISIFTKWVFPFNRNNLLGFNPLTFAYGVYA
jgi:hypothetical protein